MTLPTSLNTRFVRLVAALIVPGAIISVTFTPLVFHMFKDELQWIAESSKVAQGTGFFFLSIFFSILLENVGSRIEVSMYDHQKSESDDDNWFHYLLRPMDHECIMVRYIGEIVMRMKFEISLMLALPISFVIWLVDLFVYGSNQCGKPCIPFVIVVFISIWMFCEAKSTIGMLIIARKRMKENDDKLTKKAV